MLSKPKPVVVTSRPAGQPCKLCRPENRDVFDWIEATLRETRQAGHPRPSAEAIRDAMDHAFDPSLYRPHPNNLRNHFRRGESPEWAKW